MNQKLHLVTPRTPPRARAKADVNLSRIFTQLVELQAQFGEQMVSLEEGIQQQRELVNTMGQLPEIKEELNWLIASFYERGQQDATLRETVARHETALVNIASAVRSLCESQARWQSVTDQLAQR